MERLSRTLGTVVAKTRRLKSERKGSGFCMGVVHCIESARKIAHEPKFA